MKRSFDYQAGSDQYRKLFQEGRRLLRIVPLDKRDSIADLIDWFSHRGIRRKLNMDAFDTILSNLVGDNTLKCSVDDLRKAIVGFSDRPFTRTVYAILEQDKRRPTQQKFNISDMVPYAC